ncbi:MAG: tRNA pseudouridine(55) synthase TruB [Kiritimatiellaeota bacterium]|nr:tRNA pseudouridine(55) synthase TruB [Kiritimatiellota bacterium]
MSNPAVNIPPESGILLVDKPEEWTSHDVVNCVRRRFRIRKVGHCGTLDPAATGLLVLVLGRATKLSGRLSGQDKVYSGAMRLGIETDSQDRDGKVVAESDPSGVTREQLEDAFESFTGEILQVPPMVSAVKKDGRPLYKLARKGIEIEREPRPVTIHSLRLLGFDPPDVEFEVHCSKGTYVRTLCADIGKALGCGAHLHSLRRTRSGKFKLEDAVPVSEIKQWEMDQLLETIIPLVRVFQYL